MIEESAGADEGPDAVDPTEALTGLSDADEQRVQTAGEAEIGDLRRSLTRNRSVATATGILMERRRLPVDEAFALLVAVCQRSGRRLLDVVAELRRTGTVSGQEDLVGPAPRPPAGDTR